MANTAFTPSLNYIDRADGEHPIPFRLNVYPAGATPDLTGAAPAGSFMSVGTGDTAPWDLKEYREEGGLWISASTGGDFGSTAVWTPSATGYGSPAVSYKPGDTFTQVAFNELGGTTVPYIYQVPDTWVEGTDTTGAAWNPTEAARFTQLSADPSDPLHWPPVVVPDGGTAGTPLVAALGTSDLARDERHQIYVNGTPFSTDNHFSITKTLDSRDRTVFINVRNFGPGIATYTLPTLWQAEDGSDPGPQIIEPGESHAWYVAADVGSAFVYPLHMDDTVTPATDTPRIVVSGSGPANSQGSTDFGQFSVPESGVYEWDVHVSGYAKTTTWRKQLQIRTGTGGAGTAVLSQTLAYHRTGTDVRTMAQFFGEVTLAAGTTYTARLSHLNEYFDVNDPITLILRKRPKNVIRPNDIEIDTTDAAIGDGFVWDGTKLVKGTAAAVAREFAGFFSLNSANQHFIPSVTGDYDLTEQLVNATNNALLTVIRRKNTNATVYTSFGNRISNGNATNTAIIPLIAGVTYEIDPASGGGTTTGSHLVELKLRP